MPVNGQYYQFKGTPEVLHSMGVSYPFVVVPRELSPDNKEHYLDFDFKSKQYKFAAQDELHGKVARWYERQDYTSKVTERELIVPGYKPSDKWTVKKPANILSTGRLKASSANNKVISTGNLKRRP